MATAGLGLSGCVVEGRAGWSDLGALSALGDLGRVLARAAQGSESLALAASR